MKSNSERLEAAWLGVSWMDEAVEAKTEAKLEALLEWLGVPRMDEVVEAQTEAWLVTLSEAGWVFQGWMKLWRLRQRPGS